MKQCECSLRTRLVGDGCSVCNPAKALVYADQTIQDLTEENERLSAHLRWCVKMLKPFENTAQINAIKRDLGDA